MFGKIVSRDLTPSPVIKPGHRSYFITLTYPDVTGARKIIDQITAGVDAIELRVDLLSSSGLQVSSDETNIPPVAYVADQLGALRAMTSLPIVYTVRTKSQGGAFPDEDHEAMFKLLQLGLRMRVEFLDVEITLPQEYTCQLRKSNLPCTKIIASYHDWKGELKWTGSAMRQKYNHAVAFGDVIKLVSKANHIDDNFTLGEFVRSVNSPQKPVIAINIGPLGQLSRILNETLTPITHPALPTKGAPGQLSFAEIQKGLTIMGLLSPKRFYLFGKPIAHSPSPTLHNAGFAELGLPHRYKLFETSEVDDDIDAAISDPSFGGASVTIPHKLKIIPLLDHLSTEAKMIGAVNTIISRTLESGRKELYGDNTDWIAIRDLVSINLQQSITSSSTSLVIGAGGTSRAAIYALHALGFPTIYLFNRTKSSAEKLVESFPSSFKIVVLDKVDSFLSGQPIVVVSTIPASATALSSNGEPNSNDQVILSPQILASKKGGVVVDMAYKPAMTPLLTLASSDDRRAWKAVRGVDILIEQGCKQFELWTGRRAPKTTLTDAVLHAYES